MSNLSSPLYQATFTDGVRLTGKVGASQVKLKQVKRPNAVQKVIVDMHDYKVDAHGTTLADLMIAHFIQVKYLKKGKIPKKR